MIGFLKKHYEKIILAVLLTIFIILLVYLLMMWSESENIEISREKNYRPPAPNYKEIKPEDQKSSFNADSVWERDNVKWTSKAVSEKLPQNETTDLIIPYPMGVCPHPNCRRIIPVIDFTPQRRRCSMCNVELASPLTGNEVDTELDTDHDGIPDVFEKEKGRGQLDYNNPKDAQLDFDSDGFTNLEEYILGTDMFNAKSRIPYYHKLYVSAISQTTYRLKLKNVLSGGREAQFEFVGRTGNGKARQTDSFIKKGGELTMFDGTTFIVNEIKYSVDSSDIKNPVNKSYVIIKNKITGELIKVLTTDAVVKSAKDRIDIKIYALDPENTSFKTLADGLVKQVYKGDVIKIGNDLTGREEYKIVSYDISAKTVIIESLTDKKTYKLSSRPSIHAEIQKRLEARRKAKREAEKRK